MSFGCSVGDFVTLGTTSWKLYKLYKDAPGSLQSLSLDLLSFHAVLKEAEETLFARPLPPSKQQGLKAVHDSCYGVLTDLQNLVDKYENMGTQGKRTWERFRWGNEPIAELRARLTSNTTFLITYMSTSQTIVEKKLDRLLQKIQDTQHQGSLISIQKSTSVDSISSDEGVLWRIIRKELKEIGISVTAFDANKEFIFKWFKEAVEAGTFQDQIADNKHDFSRQHLPNTRAKGLEQAEDTMFDRVTSGAPEIQRNPPSSRLSAFISKTSHPLKDIIQFTHTAKGEIDLAPPATRYDQVKSSQPHEGKAVPGPSNSLAVRDNEIARKISQGKESHGIKPLTTQTFYDAARRGDYPKVQRLLNEETNVKTRARYLDIALQAAAHRNHVTMVQHFIRNGANVNAEGGFYGSALIAAAGRGHEKTVRILLDCGANVNAHVDIYGTALVAASRRGHEPTVRILLGSEADVNALLGAALRAASCEGHEQIVHLLIASGANINAQNSHGTALMVACYSGHTKTVEILLEKGADVNAQGGQYGSALMAAFCSGHGQTVRNLLKNGANVNALHGKLGTALIAAACKGHEQTMRSLINNGANVNAFGGKYGTALIAASCRGHEQTVRILLDHAANVDAFEERFGTALNAAACHGHEQIVRIILAHKD